ncbi:sulfotransferase domain-containing protein, partial [Betaproteobacteria bacterium]|nr:sulfotransferase domain-containing protein [Betaproteobacteria bacterium]
IFVVKFRGANVRMTNVKLPLTFVCSHERSGTHFLMNSLAKNSLYSYGEQLNFDPLSDALKRLGIDFHHTEQLAQLLVDFEHFVFEGERRYFPSLIKSHFHAHFMEQFLTGDRRFIYIFREPKDTLISFWKFLLRYPDQKYKSNPEKFYGKTITEFFKLSPCGKSARYQRKAFTDYFSRWADHVNGWIELSERNSNVILVRYETLMRDFTPTLNSIFTKFGYEEKKFCKKPNRDDFYPGESIPIVASEIRLLEHAIREKLKEQPKIVALFGDE